MIEDVPLLANSVDVVIFDSPKENAPRRQHEWDDRARHLEAELTELEWWFQSFALLRNRIAHGGEIPDDDYLFEDGAPHHWHAEWQLRRAIKQMVANAGHPDVLLDPWDRAMQAALPLLEEALERDADDAHEGDHDRSAYALMRSVAAALKERRRS